MATLDEIQEVIKIFKKYKISNYAILKCVSHYPANSKDYNLKSLIDLSKRFNCAVGLSDHTVGIGVAIASIALGGMVIEKHFKLESKKGLDSKFSISKNSMSQLVNECHEAFQSIGIVKFGPSSNEIPYLKFRRSIYASASIRKGEILSEENIKVVRPSYGLHPKFFTHILGKKVKKNIKFAERITRKKIKL
jgi:N-acetylneuraminate synthase